MFILKGKDTSKNPTSADIEKEIKNLSSGDAELLSLENKEEIISAVIFPDEAEQKIFLSFRKIVSPHAGDTISYELKSPIKESRVQKIFLDFLKGSFQIDTSWKKPPSFDYSDYNPYAPKVSMRYKVFLTLSGVVLLYGGASLASIASNEPWYYGFFAGIGAVLYFIFIILFIPFLLQLRNKVFVKISIWIGMPSYINIAPTPYLKIKQQPGIKKHFGKSILLELVLWILMIICIVIFFSVLGLALSCLLFWDETILAFGKIPQLIFYIFP